jgi:hypothetical protein
VSDEEDENLAGYDASSHARHYAIGTPSFVPVLRSTFAAACGTWLASRSSLTKFCGPPSPKLRRAAFACTSERRLVGLSRFELLTPRLSSVCSNQLSYRPRLRASALRRGRLQVCSSHCQRTRLRPAGLRRILSKLDRTCAHSREYQIDRFQVGFQPSAFSSQRQR